ncbi:MAG: ORF6N domain-containing protein [Candidatus Omnitrophica bacterium]|nr:ORF6N domain-containing protein [Candidatus Omnitrophota bacterium]
MKQKKKSINEADSLRFQFGSLKRGQYAKYLPYAFTEQGVAMFSSVLNSARYTGQYPDYEDIYQIKTNAINS